MDNEKRIKALESKVAEILNRLEEMSNQKSLARTVSKNQIGKNESPREFLLRFSPKNDTEKTLVAIHFLEVNGQQAITVKEIVSILKSMREAVPKNVSDKIQLLDKQGFLIQDGQTERRKCWAISTTGHNTLQAMQNDTKRT